MSSEQENVELFSLLSYKGNVTTFYPSAGKSQCKFSFRRGGLVRSNSQQTTQFALSKAAPPICGNGDVRSRVINQKVIDRKSASKQANSIFINP